jgi:hypothetical protein
LLSGKALPSTDIAPSVKKASFPKVSEQGVESPALRVQSGSGIFRGDSRPEIPQNRVEALVRSLNLPPDSLSAALVSFARHFSLPLDHALIARLRREALSLPKSRESSALAAAAAAGKGVELTPEALERYTAAIDPDARREQNDAGSPGGGRGESGEDGTGNTFGQASGIPGMKELEKIRDNIDEDPLLSILNSIPGKDGDRWMVYPFQIAPGGKRLLVSVRVKAGNGKDAARLVVDVAGEERRWLFVVTRPACSRRGAEPPEGGDTGSPAEPPPLLETRVSLWPPPGRRERESLEREIREALGSAGGPVILRDSESFLAEWSDEVLFSVNKEV